MNTLDAKPSVKQQTPNEMASFTSYAQNFEDVTLWRALKHVEQGCYIDIGAQHPVTDSVSKGFYEQGWRGVHVEPVRHYADLLRADRPGETVLEMAISDREGLLELQVIPDTGLSTGVKQYADMHQQTRGFEYRSVMVPMLPIRAALAAWENRPVHWMKIDIEGLEEAALRGWDSTRLRPWIVVIESTVPLSTQEVSFDMDGMLNQASYEFAYFDGLNRFYVAHEHKILLPNICKPPNIFDVLDGQVALDPSSLWCKLARSERDEALEQRDAVLQAKAALAADFNAALLSARQQHASALSEAQEKLDEAHNGLAKVRKELREAYGAMQASAESAKQAAAATARTLATAIARAELAEHEVHALRSSTSWRLTRPLRLVASLSRGQLAPHQVARLADWARRLKIFRPARAAYRHFLKGAPHFGDPAVSSSAQPAPELQPSTQGNFARLGEGDHINSLTEDARMLLRQIRPRDTCTGGAT